MEIIKMVIAGNFIAVAVFFAGWFLFEAVARFSKK